ncbi:MAG: hypothetical protein A2756_04755 [Candidatus Ryanbacteria bacterium RIFCSPHIGHO2_01_FULL_48_27]|uniref:S1 motif domain-containing protein n=1 Tax=Candidatus Ryanbacteria bacterium RIFCSPHIGHO2_01_FULL_48_27 TaxID=1802115 RepID=A0A1G2G0S3_9BACT|nr:MAG: hypothetical protein A2756_04755 [Candidatus Ryanbacteria bacterium RIFCSPHIGHO2_01_FULL_48_27]
MDKPEEKDLFETDEDESGSSIALLDASKREASRRLMEALFKNIQVAAAPKLGDLIDGHVIVRKGVYLYVDLGVYGTGIVYGREYYNAREIIKNLAPGDAIAAKVVDLENENGYVELSLQEAGQDKMWADAEEHMKNKTPLNLKVTSANKGGLVIVWQSVPGFLPVSQLTAKHYPRVEGGDKMKILNELQKFVGKTFEVTILDIDPKEDKLIFSEKNIESEELKEILGHYVVGAEIEGEVTGVVDFGVFIKIEDGLEGLAHISELDWGLVENPGDLFKVGDQVRAKIINIEAGKISLSVKALKPDPWKEFAEKYKKGDIVQGRITKINRFGAFVQVDNTLSGLVHVSEFASEKDMRDALQISSTYHFQILVLNSDEHKLSLSFINPNETKKEEAPAVTVEDATPAADPEAK